MPAETVQRPAHSLAPWPCCGHKARPVQPQTVKAVLSVSLRAVQGEGYRICCTRTCPVVYYSHDGQQTFTTEHLRERVYQKEPDRDDVVICDCFQHTVGTLRAASAESRTAVLDDIDMGISAGPCACDVRNPQGSGCLGNVRNPQMLSDSHRLVGELSNAGLSKILPLSHAAFCDLGRGAADQPFLACPDRERSLLDDPPDAIGANNVSIEYLPRIVARGMRGSGS